MRPDQAMDALVEQYAAQERSNGGQQQNQQGNPQINLPPNGVPAGARTPSMGNMQIPSAGSNQFSKTGIGHVALRIYDHDVARHRQRNRFMQHQIVARMAPHRKCRANNSR